MAESFDLLDQLGDQEKVEKLKAKIKDKKGIDLLSKLDTIEQEIEKAAEDNKSAEEIVSEIINANFNTLNGDVEATEADLQELMLHLRAMLDSCGGEFSKLQELNASEQGLISDAQETLSESEAGLKDAEQMSDAWNILFGMKNRRLRNAKKDRSNSEAELKAADIKANKLYRERLRSADIDESLNRIISQVQGMVGIVEDMILDVEKQVVALKNRKEISFETKEKAARIMEERKAELEDIEAKIAAAEIELAELPSNSPQYTEQQKKIADLRENRADVKGRYHVALGIFQSKERFVDQIVIHLEAQTTTKNNLKQLIGQLRSDTEERVTTYESGLQLIQSATAQEAASIYEEAGVKTDQKITEIAAKVFVGSEKDRVTRIKKHPKRMSELHKVLVAMAEARAKYREEDAKIIEEHSQKFGLDISETFSHTYDKDVDDSSDLKGSKPRSSSVDDLME